MAIDIYPTESNKYIIWWEYILLVDIIIPAYVFPFELRCIFEALSIVTDSVFNQFHGFKEVYVEQCAAYWLQSNIKPFPQETDRRG
jgi:hypothetical protein